MMSDMTGAERAEVMVRMTFGPNHGIEFSPSGALLATASSDATARLWDAASGAGCGTYVVAGPKTHNRAAACGVISYEVISVNKTCAAVCGGLLIAGLAAGCGTARTPPAARPAAPAA